METGLRKPLRFPLLYLWLVLLSSLDLLLTWWVLFIGGREANPVAARVLYTWGFEGMIAYKFALVSLVVVLAEIVARRSTGASRFMVVSGLLITCVPVVVALHLLDVRLW